MWHLIHPFSRTCVLMNQAALSRTEQAMARIWFFEIFFFWLGPGPGTSSAWFSKKSNPSHYLFSRWKGSLIHQHMSEKRGVTNVTQLVFTLYNHKAVPRRAFSESHFSFPELAVEKFSKKAGNLNYTVKWSNIQISGKENWPSIWPLLGAPLIIIRGHFQSHWHPNFSVFDIKLPWPL